MGGESTFARDAHSRDYVSSPLARYALAVPFAAELMLLDFTRETIAAELNLQYGFEDAQAEQVLRDARARVSRPERPHWSHQVAGVNTIGKCSMERMPDV